MPNKKTFLERAMIVPDRHRPADGDKSAVLNED
jgi:hypothetical protein